MNDLNSLLWIWSIYPDSYRLLDCISPTKSVLLRLIADLWLTCVLLLILLYCDFQAESTSATNESVLKVALDHGKASGVIKSHDRVVVCQKMGDSSVVKIIELDD